MPGKLLEIVVATGQPVSKGDRLAVLEAMKMQHEILASVDGEVSAIHGTPGDQAAVGDLILEIETAA